MGVQNEYLDLLISLATVLFLASLVVSGLHEAIQWPFRVRSKFLWAYLHDLVGRDGTRRLPRGIRGITRLWSRKSDVRPTLDHAATESSTEHTLQQIAVALDPIGAPALFQRRTGTKTTIQNVPPTSLAQSFVEVMSNGGRRRLADGILGVASYAANASFTGESPNLALERHLSRIFDELVSVDADTASEVRAAFDEFGRSFTSSWSSDQSSDGSSKAGRRLEDRLKRIFDTDGNFPEASQLGLRVQQACRQAESRTGSVDPGAVRAAAHDLTDAFDRVLPEQSLEQRIQSGIDTLRGTPLGPTAQEMWSAAERDVDAFRRSLGDYFDSEMIRLSGYYKRSIRFIVALIALVVTVAGNIDTIDLANGLWHNPDGRSALLQQADQVLASATAPTTTVAGDGAAATGTFVPSIAQIRQECEARTPTTDPEGPDPEAVAEALRRNRVCVDDALTKLNDLGVIDGAVWSDARAWADSWAFDQDFRPWLLHFLGVLMTWVALFIGAPFWFDIIKRLTGIRKNIVGQT
jgi:hypothetical protein